MADEVKGEVTAPIQTKSEPVEPSGPDEINLEGYTVSKSEMAKLGVDLKGPKKLDLSKFANDVEDTGDGDNIEEEKEPEELKASEEEETVEPYEESEEEEPIAAKKLADTDEIDIVVDGEDETWPVSKVKAELQKRLNYTREKQKLAVERKEMYDEANSFEEQRVSWMKENKAKLLKVDTYDSFHQYLADADPELHSKIDEHARLFNSQFHNPVIQRALAEKDKELESTKQNMAEIENSLYRMKWDIEKSNFERTFATQYKPLFDRSKIKLDMSELKKAWIDSDKSLLEIFEQKYSKSLASLSASKTAVNAIKNTTKDIPTLGKPRPRVAVGVPKGRKYSHDEMAERLIVQMGLN